MRRIGSKYRLLSNKDRSDHKFACYQELRIKILLEFRKRNFSKLEKKHFLRWMSISMNNYTDLKDAFMNLKNSKVCVICKNVYEGYGSNAEPIVKGRCCDTCNNIVIDKRIEMLRQKQIN